MLRTFLLFFFFFTCCSVQLSASVAEDAHNHLQRQAGLALVLDDSANAFALAGFDGMRVQLLVQDRSYIAELRAQAVTQGLLNTAFFIEYGHADTIPLADNYADIVIMPSAKSIPATELQRILRPGAQAYDKTGTVVAIGLEEPETDDYGHWFHSPDNNPVSTDTQVQWPFATQWVDLPYRGPQPCINLVSGGYIYTLSGFTYHPMFGMNLLQEPYTNTLIVRNAYNGIQLWKRPLPENNPVAGSVAVADGNTFYLLEQNAVLVFEAQSGKEIRRITLPSHGKWIGKHKDQLIVLSGPDDSTALARPAKQPKYIANITDETGALQWGAGTHLCAFDVDGTEQWCYEQTGIDSRLLAIANNAVYCGERNGSVRALSLTDGSQLWENTSTELKELMLTMNGGKIHALQGTHPGIMATADVLVIHTKKQKHVVTLSTTDGQILWNKAVKKDIIHSFWHNEQLFLGTKNASYVEAQTGNAQEKAPPTGMGCGTPVVTKAGILGRQGMVYDFTRQVPVADTSNRSGCWQNCIPAHGLVYYTPYTCSCNYTLRGVMAVCSVPKNFPHTDLTQTPVAGTAQAGALRNDDTDWPCYRGNNSRSASSTVSIASAPSLAWTQNIGARPNAAIAIQQHIFFGDSTGTIHCYTDNGKLVWQFHSGGRIYSSPSFADGILYAGSGDGYIYALNSDTGALIWQHKVAPYQRRIQLYGTLSDAWPVTSGILIENGIIYAAAGIIDRDGTTVCALDAHTGAVKWVNDSSCFADPVSRKGASAMGQLTISNNTLWLAGGNACSPAGYNLETGAFTIPGYFSRNVYDPVRRGQEIGVIANTFVIHGGNPLFSDPHEWINGSQKGGSCAFGLIKDDHSVKYPEWLFSDSNTMPAWDNTTAIVHNWVRKESGIESWDISSALPIITETITAEKDTLWGQKKKQRAYFGKSKKDKKIADFAMKQWRTTDKKPFNFVRSMVLTHNCALVVNGLAGKQYAAIPQATEFTLHAYDRASGEQIWSVQLPDEPIDNGLCVNRDGNIIISTLSGKVLFLKQ